MDTTRADHLGAWGDAHAHTPNLDALAARGTRFARCDTAAPITLPSHATILTGLFPPRHGVRDNGTFVLAPKVETLAERLAARGYDTAAVVSAVVLARRQGLDQGFRVYDDDLGAGYAAGHPGRGADGRGDHRRRPARAGRPARRPSSSGCTTTIRTRSTGRPPASPTPPAGPTASTTARSPTWTSRSARC